MTGRLSDVERNPSLAVRIARSLAEGIEREVFRPGDKLPTEQELGVRFGVSRSVIREAIATLRADGLVISRQGSGVFVAPANFSRPFQIDAAELSSIRDVLHLMQLRLGVEVEAAGCAAEVRAPVGLIAMDAALRRMDEAIEAGEHSGDLDAAFHFGIAEATGNRYFGEFLHFLGRLIIQRQFVKLNFDSVEVKRVYMATVQDEHRALNDAICRADAIAARRLMQAHLRASMRRYQTLASSEEFDESRFGEGNRN